MTTITGKIKTGKERAVEIERQGDTLYLWIHTPGDDTGGYEILVSTAQVVQALRDNGVLEAGQ